MDRSDMRSGAWRTGGARWRWLAAVVASVGCFVGPLAAVVGCLELMVTAPGAGAPSIGWRLTLISGSAGIASAWYLLRGSDGARGADAAPPVPRALALSRFRRRLRRADRGRQGVAR